MLKHRSSLVLLLVLSFCATAHCAAHPGRIGLGRSGPIRISRMTVQSQGALSVSFFALPESPQIVDAGNGGMLDLGAVSSNGHSQLSGVKINRKSQEFDVAADLGMRIGQPSTSGQTVALKAWLGVSANPYHVFFDDVQLGGQPVCVDAHMEVGVLTRHELRISVPLNASGDQSTLQAVISMQVIQN